MIKSKAIRKIFITTLALFIVLVVYSIQNVYTDSSLKVNLEIEDVTGLTNNSVFLLNNDGYLVKKKIFIESDVMAEKINKIISYLKENNNSKYSSSLKGLIPKDTKVLSTDYDEGYVTVHFSKEFYNSNDLDLSVTALVYSILDLDKVKGLSILVNGEPLEGYPLVLTKNMDINKETNITSRDDITKVVVYYLVLDNSDKYYVPVTKYLNDSREKIAIIVDELASSKEENLVSYVNSNVELIESRLESDMLILNFNNFLFDSSDEVLEEVLYCISYSVFDNYDVSAVSFEVNGKKVNQVYKENI